MHSVSPYIRKSFAPGKVLRTSATVAAGSEAPALVRNRRCGSSRSASPRSETSIANTVGTPASPVTSWRSRSSTTRPGRAIPGSRIKVAPTRMLVKSCESP